jgi:hypothetical protein
MRAMAEKIGDALVRIARTRVHLIRAELGGVHPDDHRRRGRLQAMLRESEDNLRFKAEMNDAV